MQQSNNLKKLHLTKTNRYLEEVYQIYNCLYGIHIKLDSDHSIVDHETKHQPFEKDFIMSALETVYDHLKARLMAQNARAMTSESKECLGTLLSAAGIYTIPNGKLMMNKCLVDSYLKKSSEFIICTTLDPTFLLPSNSLQSIIHSETIGRILPC